jgi:diguanylate cyclase (GGDEF)-like protein
MRPTAAFNSSQPAPRRRLRFAGSKSMLRVRDASQLRPLLERQLKTGFPWLRFEPILEEGFTQYFSAQRLRFAVVLCLFGIAVFDLMSLSERVTLPDRFDEMLLCRWGIFTPLGLLWIAAFRRWPTASIYEAGALMQSVLGVLLPMTVMMYSDSPHRFSYQTGSVMTMLYFVIVLRTRFRVTMAGLVVMGAIQLVTCKYSGAFDAVAYASILWFYIPIIGFLMLSAYFLERADRSNFLALQLNDCLHQDLARQARLDPLTGLENRRSLLEFEAMAPRSPLFAFMIDIDHFKRFNDSYGHVRGDECICAIATAVREAIGADGRVFRYGGEEILVLTPQTDLHAAFDRAEAIRAAIARLAISHPVLGPDRKVTVSIGVAAADLARTRLAELIGDADKALYEAKAAGRDRVWPSLDFGLEPRQAFFSIAGAPASAAPR